MSPSGSAPQAPYEYEVPRIPLVGPVRAAGASGTEFTITFRQFDQPLMRPPESVASARMHGLRAVVQVCDAAPAVPDGTNAVLDWVPSPQSNQYRIASPSASVAVALYV